MAPYQALDTETSGSTITAAIGNLAGSSRMDALGALGYFYLKHRQTQKALVLFSALARLMPGDPGITLSLAYAHYLAGSYPEALTLSRAVLDKESPLRSAARILHSRTLIKLGRNNEARQLMRLKTKPEETL